MSAARDGWRRGTVWLVILLLSCSGSSWSRAAGVTVEVLDVAGEPVEHAAVVLHAEFSPDSSPGARTEVIDQQDRQFRPWVSAVTVGDRLVFANSDEITHHVYSFSPVQRFSFRLQAGERRSPMTMERSGIVVLGCNIHDWMVGYIVVGDGRRAATTDEAGTVRFADLPPGRWQVAVWHPGLEASERPDARAVELSAQAVSRVVVRLSSSLNERGPRKPLSEGNYGAP